jgi:hypothetical protein
MKTVESPHRFPMKNLIRAILSGVAALALAGCSTASTVDKRKVERSTVYAALPAEDSPELKPRTSMTAALWMQPNWVAFIFSKCSG